ncbi:MAG: DUF4363 family protein [Oscillospiraceae bacterium]|nr:DUF4363 family protein [Oscillospiraceae bacterium]
MKRGLLAAGLLILLFALLLANIHALDALIGAVEKGVCRSSAALRAGDAQLAASEAEAAMKLWQSKADYAHIVLRQETIDAVSEAFFELLEEIRSDGGEAEEAYLSLLYHLDSIARMEHLRLSSVF